MTTHRIAVIQDGPVPGDAMATAEKMSRLAAGAKAQGARLALFPEAFVGGYPKGADFHIFLGGRTPQGRAQYQRYAETAIAVPGPVTERIGQIAAEQDMFIVVGVIEHDGGTLYCTILFFSPEGELLGKHRKLMPTALERLLWGFGDGSTFPVYDTPLGRLGAVVCWENYMPLLRMAMYGKQIQIYCAPTADDKPTWVSTMQHVALEGRCFVLSACQHLRGKDFPPEFHNALDVQPDTVLMRGGSCIVDPMGQLLAGPVYDEDAILVADIDLDAVTRGKMDFDVVGHYARPDIFSLTVDERPKPPVTTLKP
ncbi:carbon-nitrogen hydrolase family protein [Bordetella bronchiseptica]|uniref:carbon-nitrogen hydrolase family protein n=1 Tax=Bordetella bronchiseptica TaxID=518 RepID=UPI00081C86A2|nr:carbon-nitrogen hydrolase family protein [Bordetella bronchiseptica]AOB25698.1 nitrilase [Bordetella bronchiseptica]AZW42960.1 nitrilase [Bordetella bronchiseptica]